MRDFILLRVITRLLIPFIIMYGFYIQFHGEYSPGGGFQAGVIIAAAFVAYAFVHGIEKCMDVLPLNAVKFLAAFGVLIYGFVGLTTMFLGGNFLSYSYLSEDAVAGQKLGIILIELGVGTTVFAVMMLIFFAFAKRS